jgi:hypothetical protein
VYLTHHCITQIKCILTSPYELYTTFQYIKRV